MLSSVDVALVHPFGVQRGEKAKQTRVVQLIRVGALQPRCVSSEQTRGVSDLPLLWTISCIKDEIGLLPH